MGIHRVVLRLARNPDAGFPEGDDQRGYVIIAPLDQAGLLDAELWRTRRKDCTVVRFSPHDDERAHGWLVRRGGPDAAVNGWFLHYDAAGAEDETDERGYKLGAHRFLPGDYITIRDDEGDGLTYKVTESAPA